MSTHGQMLTHGEVVKTLEQIVGIGVKVVPDTNSSSKPVEDSDTPKYWQIFLTPEHSKRGVYVATLCNANYPYTPIPSHSGIIHAKIESEATCNVHQKEIDQLLQALEALTQKKVYLADNVYMVHT